MKTKFALYFFFILFILFFQTGPVCADQIGINKLSLEAVSKLDSITNEYRDKLNYARIGISYKGNIVFTKSYVKDNVSESGEWASISKPATTMIVMQLLAQGKINSLDDDVWKYSSRYQNSIPSGFGEHLTIRNLLAHQGGVQYAAPLWKDGKLDLRFEPGKDIYYSSGGFGIVGDVIRGATGKGYKQLVEEYLGSPVSASSITAREQDDAAREVRFSDWQSPAAFISSTIEDMAKFSGGIMNNAYVSSSVMRDQMLNYKVACNYYQEYNGYCALTWAAYNSNGRLYSFHTGDNGAQRSVILNNMDDKIGIVIQFDDSVDLLNERVPWARSLMGTMMSYAASRITCASSTCVGNSCWDDVSGSYVEGIQTEGCATVDAAFSPSSIIAISENPPEEITYINWSAKDASKLEVECDGIVKLEKGELSLSWELWRGEAILSEAYEGITRTTAGFPVYFKPGTVGKETCTFYPYNSVNGKLGTPKTIELLVGNVLNGYDCGTAATYLNSKTINDWGSKSLTFCKVGSPNPLNPIAPSKGKPTTWKCKGTAGLETECKAFYDNTAPTGTISANGCTISGKVTDSDRPNEWLSIDIYKNELKEGNFISRFNTQSNGTFSYTFSESKESEKQFFDNKEHAIVTHALGKTALGASDNLNPALTGSPLKIKCAPDSTYACQTDNSGCNKETCSDLYCFDGCNMQKGELPCKGMR